MQRKPVIREVQRFTGSIIGSALGDAIGEIVLRESVSGYKSLEDIDHVYGRQDLLRSINSHKIL